MGQPAQCALRQSNVGLALAGVVGRQRLFDQRQFWVNTCTYFFSELANGELVGIAQIDGPCGVAIHQADQAVDQIVDITKRTALAPIAVKGDWFTAQGLHDEIAHNATVIGQHAWAIGVEDAGDANLAAMHSLIVEAEGFSDAFAFVVTSSNAYRIHTAAVALGLRVHIRVAIHLTGRCQQKPRLNAASQTKHVVSTKEAGFCGLHRIGLILNRGSGAGEVPDAVNLKLYRFGDVMADELKAGVIPPLTHVGLATGEGVVETEHLVTGLHQAVDQVRTEKAGASGDQIANRTCRHRQLELMD